MLSLSPDDQSASCPAADHLARVRERKLASLRAAEDKLRQQAEHVQRNAEEEGRRKEMLERVAHHEAALRSRLATEIMQADAAVRLRRRGIAEARQQVVEDRAAVVVAQLRRAKSAKALREASEVERIKRDVQLREGERAQRVERARAAKELERLEYVRRNAEEEGRRIRALGAMQQKEAKQKVALVRTLVRSERAHGVRLRRVVADKVKDTVELGVARQKQLARAAEARHEKEACERHMVQYAAAAKEKARKEKAQRVAELKESQRLYYVQRNAMAEAAYERHGQEVFEAEMQPATVPAFSKSSSTAGLLSPSRPWEDAASRTTASLAHAGELLR